MPPGRLGMVLPGGAARGAYEAGVLRYLFCELPKNLGYAPWPDIVAGTSVGALNSAFVAGRDAEGVQWLSQTYRDLEIPDVYGITYADMFRTIRDAFRDEAFAFADPEPLQRLVFSHFPRKKIRKAIDEQGAIWIVGATDLRTGFQVLFVDMKGPPHWTPRPGVYMVHTQIRSIHTLASASLPLLFPPIRVGDRLLVDGGLRMNTPLRPVIRAGADRVILVSLKRQSQDTVRVEQSPNLPFLVGKTLNALMLDPMEQDLFDAGEMNALIEWGTEHFGAEFARKLHAEHGRREVDVLFIAPTVDVGEIAASIYAERPPVVRGALGALLNRAAGAEGPDADLLSYLYFDKEYTGALEQLGFEDAKKQEEAIVKVVAPDM
ncbi:MAG: patatin-like phospholipase family protein [Myxococcales bacterium]|nr:patatin-like phospholipase family protein [Myxococcales bacterium]